VLTKTFASVTQDIRPPLRLAAVVRLIWRVPLCSWSRINRLSCRTNCGRVFSVSPPWCCATAAVILACIPDY
jgi:hypothetical protein